MARDVLFHFSEDPNIERFVPHVPPTNPSQAPAVWAIDGPHAPLYWFPRDCPRVTAWPRQTDSPADFQAVFGTDASRLQATELGWLERMRSTVLYRYEFEPSPFEPWGEAAGQWISHQTVEPMRVVAVGGLLDEHAEAGVELRFVKNLWHLADLVVDDRWEFSAVRMSNAQPRP